MKIKFTDIEKKHLLEIEKDEWNHSKNFRSLNIKLKNAAHNTLLKDARMNIRIASRDIELLKTKAMEEGIPYQTLVSSILHKYVTGRIEEINH